MVLKILFVQEAPCIRNYKMAVALRSVGHKVSLAYTKARLSQMYKGLDDNVYNKSIHLRDMRHLWDISKEYDIIHCHNEPDILTVAALAGDAPVIHDTHDLISLRAGGNSNLSYFEGVANRGSAGRVYTTSYQLKEAERLYGVEGPSVVFNNFASEGDLPKRLLPKLSEKDGKVHIVYEGSVGGTAHRDFAEIFIYLAEKDLQIHIYPTFFSKQLSEYFMKYENVSYYNPVSPQEIIQVMTQYDFGIIPFNLKKGNKRFLDSTIANKLYEYQAAGLPIIASALKTYDDYFKDNPVGVIFKNPSDIIEQLPRLNQMKKSIDFSKRIFTYESEIGRLVEFYHRIIKKPLSNDYIYEPKEDIKAKEYWCERKVIEHYYTEGRQSSTIVQTVSYLNNKSEIKSIFEFGCNVGRNLNCLRRDIPGIDLFGIDINKDAIRLGKEKYNLPLKIGSEEQLSSMKDGEYDAVFTVSVLDHLPDMEKILVELLRISKHYFIAIEPFIDANINAKNFAKADYSYFWNYPKIFNKLGARILHDKPCPLSDNGLGPFYHLYVVIPPS